MNEIALRRLFPKASADFIRQNLGVHVQEAKGLQAAPSVTKPAGITLRQRTGPKLNKTETDFLAWLLERYPEKEIRAQAVTLVIANGTRYTVDFTNLRQGLAWETKGAHAWDDSLVKLKVAASQYPELKFHLVQRNGADWRIQERLP